MIYLQELKFLLNTVDEKWCLDKRPHDSTYHSEYCDDNTELGSAAPAEGPIMSPGKYKGSHFYTDDDSDDENDTKSMPYVKQINKRLCMVNTLLSLSSL